jgi:hypothetical protein
MARLHRTNASVGPPRGKRTSEPNAESLEHLREIEASWRTPVKTGGALGLEGQRDAESRNDDVDGTGAMLGQDVVDDIAEALGVPRARDAEIRTSAEILKGGSVSPHRVTGTQVPQRGCLASGSQGVPGAHGVAKAAESMN